MRLGVDVGGGVDHIGDDGRRVGASVLTSVTPRMGSRGAMSTCANQLVRGAAAIADVAMPLLIAGMPPAISACTAALRIAAPAIALAPVRCEKER